MRYSLLLLLLLTFTCTNPKVGTETADDIDSKKDFTAMLDSIWVLEQEPIKIRDSLIRVHGADSKEAQVPQAIYKSNHIINEKKVRAILDNYGWPDSSQIGENGNRTICNVIQHSDSSTRIRYLPLMREAVLDKKLEASYLVRAEDRIATDRGQLQIYGGQMKYYPETKSFNVWPVYDPVNINTRRAEIGLGTIEEHLKNRFDFEWNLEEQIKRSEEFEKARLSKVE